MVSGASAGVSCQSSPGVGRDELETFGSVRALVVRLPSGLRMAVMVPVGSGVATSVQRHRVCGARSDFRSGAAQPLVRTS